MSLGIIAYVCMSLRLPPGQIVLTRDPYLNLWFLVKLILYMLDILSAFVVVIFIFPEQHSLIYDLIRFNGHCCGEMPTAFLPVREIVRVGRGVSGYVLKIFTRFSEISLKDEICMVHSAVIILENMAFFRSKFNGETQYL